MTSFGSTVSYYHETAWVSWCDQDAGTTCTSTETCDVIWPAWVGETAASAASGATTGTSTTWYNWNEGYAQDPRNYESSTDWGFATKTRESQKQREESRKKMEELRKKKEAAEEMALDLLEEFIGFEQRVIYEETGRLLVKGKKADYILSKDEGVTRVEKNKVVDLCIHLKERYGYPSTDNVIALALKVKDDEKGFNKMANNHGERSRPFSLPMCANGFG